MSAPVVAHPGELRWETRLLVAVTAVLTVFGIASMYSAAALEAGGSTFLWKQSAGAAGGLLLLTVVSRFDYHFWQRHGWAVLVLCLVLLLPPALRIPGLAPRINGAHRWLQFGPVQFQPSEFARFAIVVWAAMLATKKGETVRIFKVGLAPFLLVTAVVCLLILRQPNLSMAALMVFLVGLVLFAAGARIGHFLLLGVLVLFGGASLIMAASYRATRLKCFLDPGCGEGSFQLKQALIGFGSGGPFGVGFGQGQLKMKYLPYGYSDFLFSTIGEEWGFFGVFVIALLFAVFCWLGFRIARTAPDRFGQLLAVGLTGWVALAATLHAAVNLGLMPTTGLGLPFMSSGLSNLGVAFLTVGVLVSIGRARGRPARGTGGGGR